VSHEPRVTLSHSRLCAVPSGCCAACCEVNSAQNTPLLELLE